MMADGDCKNQVSESNCDSEVMPVSPLDNSLVVQRILRHLNTRQLLELSTVNKLWYHEARCLLRDHRKCEIFIMGRRPCKEIKLFNDQLAKMKLVPFNALSVEKMASECPTEATGISVKTVYRNVINKMNLKQLSVTWYSRPWLIGDKCLLGQLILRFLSLGLPELEHLEIDNMPLLDFELSGSEAPVGFPKLKTLMLPQLDFEEALSCKLIREGVIGRAPNLEGLENIVLPEQLEKIPPEILKFVRNLILPRDSEEADENVLNVLQRLTESCPRLVSVEMYPLTRLRSGSQGRRRYWNLVWNLLNSSSDTLESMTIDLYSIMMLNKLGSLQLKNVTELKIRLQKDQEAGIKTVLLRLQIQAMFPSVKKIEFSGSSDIPSFTVPRGYNDELWPTVTKIVMYGSVPVSPLLQDFAMISPSLESVVLSTIYSNDTNGGPPFKLLWSQWPGLKFLKIGNHTSWNITSLDMNLDAVFCGIYPKEADLLRQMDDYYLKAVNIVAPFPAINHLRDLQEVSIFLCMKEVLRGEFELRRKRTRLPNPEGTEPTGSFFLSKVTGFVALKQLKTLKFHLKAPTKCAKHLEHLKPWVEMEFREYW